MRKAYFLLCLMFALSAFVACSDDDDEAGILLPVTEIIVPARVQAGGELILAGNGYAQDCKILLKNSTGSVELTVSERLSASVSCTVPATLTPGEYTVILVQNGEWPLRKITVLEEGAGNPDAPVVALVIPSDPINAGEEVYIQGIGFAKNCEIDLKVGEELQKMEITVSNNGVKFNVPEALADGMYAVVLKQDGGKWTLGEITVKSKAVEKKIQIDQIIDKAEGEVIENNYTYDPEGRISAIETFEDGDPVELKEFEWTDGSLTVNIYYYAPDQGAYDKEYPETYAYTLGADGKVASSKSGNWGYSETGYFSEIQDYSLYTYEGGNHLTQVTFYGEGWSSVYKLDYTSETPNLSGLDLMGEILFRYVETPDEYYARIAGIAGKSPDLLPTSIIDESYPDEPLATMEYETNPDGSISKIIYSDGRTLEITYK